MYSLFFYKENISQECKLPPPPFRKKSAIVILWKKYGKGKRERGKTEKKKRRI
jgi:hypothetical protein